MKPDPSHFKIDQDSLDVEWLRQPELYHTYAQALADAKRSLEERREDLSRLEAELQMNIRNDPEAYGLPKVTESAIEAAVKDEPSYVKASNAVIVAKHTVDLRQADCTALDHKRKALENLVHLFGLDYFSEPRARSEEAYEGIEEIQKQSVRRRGRARRSRREADDD